MYIELSINEEAYQGIILFYSGLNACKMIKQ